MSSLTLCFCINHYFDNLEFFQIQRIRDYASGQITRMYSTNLSLKIFIYQTKNRRKGRRQKSDEDCEQLYWESKQLSKEKTFEIIFNYLPWNQHIQTQREKCYYTSVANLSTVLLLYKNESCQSGLHGKKFRFDSKTLKIKNSFQLLGTVV